LLNSQSFPNLGVGNKLQFNNEFH